MNLETAIETQETYLKGEEAVEHDKLIASMKLGIGAIQQIKREREKGVGFWADRLPGETKD